MFLRNVAHCFFSSSTGSCRTIFVSKNADVFTWLPPGKTHHGSGQLFTIIGLKTAGLDREWFGEGVLERAVGQEAGLQDAHQKKSDTGLWYAVLGRVEQLEVANL